MTNEWRDFLTSHKAQINAQGAIRFPKVEHSVACRLFDLSHLGLIAATGDDTKAFLQGQLTNDTREVSETYSHLSGHCSQKGRMLALFRVFERNGTTYLQTPAERIPEAIKRLGIFILRSKVTLTDASDSLVRIGLAGDCAQDLLAASGLDVPARDNGLATTREITAIRIPGPTPRFELLAPVAAMTDLWAKLAEHATPANTEDWKLLDIQAGLPTVYDATVEAFVPQMTNLHLVEGVSFHKGCYTGQEVVARMQFLGKLKRRMYLAEVETEMPPRPGDALHSSASQSQQVDGRVVEVAPLSEGRYALLVVTEIAAAEAGDVRLGEEGPNLINLREPPYGFPAPEAESGSK
ncbi:folate-binding protein YgfZ [Thiorhodococcus mannitoliphagus]|uniref:Folate-binding protein YgfZ n=1 Tax=Thiorhodococcus mannitoliphagus TaxID=329406 RepID=A0A6P1DTL8_9GAMM|nr:folate-binding protein YgfZ [Thiorhodococcus mannitoliphagus]NEX21667.1 folate-binding protein YgfZ [Thiorhodococcus mannitoliphagus]